MGVQKAKDSMDMLNSLNDVLLGSSSQTAWCAIPVGQLRATWCQLGPLAPILYGLVYFICRSYACSLVATVSDKYNARRRFEIQKEQRRKASRTARSVKE